MDKGSQRSPWTLGLLLGLLVTGCGRRPSDSPVRWTPEHPRPGDTLWITFSHPDTSSPELFLQVFTPQRGVFLRILPMTPAVEGAQALFPLPEDAALVRFKIEAGDQTFDEGGLGYTVVVMRDSVTPMPTAYRWLGKLWEGGDLRPELDPAPEKAIRAYQEELRWYPRDPLARVWLWRLQNELLGISPPSARQREAIRTLLTSSTPEAIHAAIFFSWKMARDLARAADLTLQLLREHADYGYGPLLAMDLVQDLRATDSRIRILSTIARQYPETPEGGKAHYLLAELFLDRGDTLEAISSYQKAIQTYPHPEAFIRLARLWADLGKAEQALTVVRKGEHAISTGRFYDREYPFFKGYKRQAWPEGDLADLLSLAAELWEEQGDLENALTYAEKAASLKAEFPPPEDRFLLLGRIHQALGHTQKAEAALLKALSLDPTMEEASKLLLTLWEAQGLPNPEAVLRERLIQTLGLKLRPAPQLEAKDLQGKTVRLSDFRGKIVVLNFWATWCTPCRREIPDLNKLVEMYRDHPDVVFLAITDERPDVVEAFLQGQPFHYRILFSKEGRRIYRVTGIPTHVILTPDGRVAFRHVGSFPNIHLRLAKEIETVRTLLASPSA